MKPSKQSSEIGLSYTMYYVILVVFAMFLLAFFLYFMKAKTVETVNVSCSNEANILASRVESTFERINSNTELINTSLAPLISSSDGDIPDSWSVFLNILTHNFPGILGYAIIDPEDRIILSSHPDAPWMGSVAGQILERRTSTAVDELYITQSIQIEDSSRILFVVSNLYASDSTVIGNIATAVDLSYFERLFSEIDVGRGGMVSMRRTDNSRLVIRWPFISARMNNPAPDIPPQRRINAGDTIGVIRYDGRTDGVDRIFAYHRLDRYPFYILVGREVREQMEEYNQIAAVSTAAVLLILIFMGILLSMLKKSAYELRKIETNYRAVVESQTDAVCRWLPDTTLTFVNSRYRDLFLSGDLHKIHKIRWIDHIPLSQMEAALERHRELERSPEIKSYEQKISLKDGSERLFHWTNVPILDSSGRLTEIQSVGRDITDRILMESALRESEEKYRFVFENSPAGMIYLNRDGTVTACNQNAAVILGANKDKLLNNTVDNIPDASISEGAKSALEGTGISTEIRLEEIGKVISASFSPIKKGAQVLGAIGILEDISQKSLAEDKLRESEEKFRNIFQNHSAVKLLINPGDGQILDANEAAAKFYGWTVSELKAMKIGQINTASESEVAENIRKAAGTEKNFFEFRHRKADGSVADVEVYTSPVKFGEKNVLHSIIHDITEKRRIELQLQQSQKMESVGKLAGGIAHDFNNILQGIMGYCEVIMEQFPPESEMYHNVNEVNNSAMKAAALTRQLLAFARKQVIAPRSLNLNDSVGMILKMLRRLIGEDITLTWEPGRDLWPVRVDPTQIDQILANITVNARDAIAGIGTITIELENRTIDKTILREDQDIIPGDYVMLAMSDDGCGMDQDTVKNIFEPFYTTKKTGEGTGLGLATVYGIIKQNNGFIKVSSEPGKGTTFELYFPRDREADSKSISTAGDTMPRGNMETILVVEDDTSIISVIRAMLENIQYRVFTASNPSEALDFLERSEGCVDLLLTDIIMPSMNGRELARRVSEKFPAIRILYMSGYTADIIANQGILEKNVNFISKPFTQKDLAREIRKVLED